MNDAHAETVLTALRALLIAFGGQLVSRGYTDNNTVNEVVGSLMVLIPAAWAAAAHYRAEAKAQAREAVAVNVGIVKADSTVGPTPLVSPTNTQAVIAQYKPLVTASEVLNDSQKGTT
ncbi:MAG TPA: hypothetical protein VLH12_08590 [Usitatibacter sp.]|nr:hypothetical protein [Usitatibacter sp.]